ncbi:MAG TPA: CPBP family intramembrane metalloprotease [Spirochaetota bacterium]|nr:CPBP family intramembrane metalloprotease [Spirochaetota bacterium]HNT09985.1 CPBP family intramembrane metalloprotease [Spirochaetota bacterium]HNV45682.1 CPBP family intramembrane metalloprotease [Spirochaetota bacterium]HOS38236.1 CPBP family intramembrane metalloprotease [Spirochaetota bacterium]HPI21808.1 CPBP family intramembrane metalloprotease [Spirochaetota bacterium]
MVKLDNPYPDSSYRSVLAPVALLFALGFVCCRVSFFSGLYQYAILLFVVILVACFFDRGLIGRDRLFSWPSSVSHLVVGITAAVALFFAVYILLRLTRNIAAFSIYFTAGGALSKWELFATAAVLLPVIEEALFRGFIQHNLANSFGAHTGLALGSAIAILFSLLFTRAVWVALPLAALTLLTGFLYMRYRSLAVSIAAHGSFALLLYVFVV